MKSFRIQMLHTLNNPENIAYILIGFMFDSLSFFQKKANLNVLVLIYYFITVLIISILLSTIKLVLKYFYVTIVELYVINIK